MHFPVSDFPYMKIVLNVEAQTQFDISMLCACQL